MTTTVAIGNSKGGVGKTTSTVNLAHVLISRGKKVLAVDFDPQASLTSYFGHQPAELAAQGLTIEKVLLDSLVGSKSVSLQDIILEGEPDLIGVSSELADTEKVIAKEWDTTRILRDLLVPLQEEATYDYILIDCAPTLAIVCVNALAAADTLVIPISTELMSLEKLPDFLRTVERVQTYANPQLQHFGVIPTKFHSRNNHDNDVLESIRALMEPHNITVFGPIGYSTVFNKAATLGVPTISRFPRTRGIENYQQLGDDLINQYG